MTATIPAHAPRLTPAPPPIPRDPAARDPGWPGRWPRQDHLELAALVTAPGCARAHVCAVLWEWKLDAIGEESALIVSEIVTNAVLSTQAQRRPDPIRLWMLGDGPSVLFLIWDATMPAPVLTSAPPSDAHGRGLALVDALCTQWGYYRPDGHPGGKVVWALMQALSQPMQQVAWVSRLARGGFPIADVTGRWFGR